MKKFKIDLSNYTFPAQVHERNADTGKIEVVDKDVEENVKDTLVQILNLEVYDSGIETCHGVAISRKIAELEENEIVIDEKDHKLLMKCFDKLISREHKPEVGQLKLGGPRYIPLIERVFNPEEVTE